MSILDQILQNVTSCTFNTYQYGFFYWTNIPYRVHSFIPLWLDCTENICSIHDRLLFWQFRLKICFKGLLPTTQSCNLVLNWFVFIYVCTKLCNFLQLLFSRISNVCLFMSTNCFCGNPVWSVDPKLLYFPQYMDIFLPIESYLMS